MVVYCTSQGVAALPARRRQSVAQGGRLGHVLASGPLQRVARCALRVRGLVSTASSDNGGGASAGGAEAHLEDANWVYTALNKAVEQEDYARASQCVRRARLKPTGAARRVFCAALRHATRRRLRDRLRELVGEWAGPTDWYGLGVPKWLADRAERLGFRLPTEVQRRVLPPANAGMDVVLRSSTGSGKTLAFLLPALANLDFVQRALPQVLIVVPTRELGIQHVMLAWRLLGGNISRRMPGDRANMFSYSGPQGVQVRGLFDARDVQRAATRATLEGVSVVVGTPAALGRAIACGALNLTCVDQLVVDEADVCLPGGEDVGAPEAAAGPAAAVLQAALEEPHAVMEAEIVDDAAENTAGSEAEEEEEMAGPPPPPLRREEAAALWSAPSSARQRWHTVIAGATVPDACLEAARAAGLIPDPVLVQVGTPAALPASLRHRLVLVAPPPPGGPPPARRVLAALCRLIRRDLAACSSPDEAPARGIVFAADDDAARDAAEPLRAALWGSHTLSVLLPSGAEPTRAAHAFRDGAASLMLTTPASERGLDMPAVRFVYSMRPPDSATAYLHRAGRAARIGATEPATVTTLCLPEDAPVMRALAAELGLRLQEEPEPAPALGEEGEASDAAATVQSLEDLFNLM